MVSSDGDSAAEIGRDGKIRRFMSEETGGSGEIEQLRRSDERFRLLVERVQDYAIFMLDPDGHVASWNVGAERIKGYAPRAVERVIELARRHQTS